MGNAKKNPPVKLILGFIYKNKNACAKATASLKRKFGRIDFESPPLPFNYTEYYQKEFGKNLLRKFISFEKLILPETLPEIKTITNKLENRLTDKDSRTINLDPGYLDLAKLVLATTKDYNHRIYLDKGIYAEITLFYRGKTFQPWEWTYPDYRSPEYIAIFNHIRGIYMQQIKYPCLKDA